MENQNSHTNEVLELLKKVSNDFAFPTKIDKKFQNIQAGANYHVSFYMVGERILLTFPLGDSSDLDMETYYRKRNEFLDIYGPEDKKIVEIRNYSDIYGFPNKKSRLIQTENLIKDNDRLLAFIILSSPVFVKIVFKVGMKLNKTKFPVFFYNNSSSALKKATNIINFNLYTEFTPKILQKLPDYNLTMLNFEVEFAIIPERLIYLKGKGSPDISQTKTMCKTEKALLNRYFSKSSYIYRIADYSEIKKSGLKARIAYAKHLKTLYNNGKLVKNNFVVGASPFVKNAILMFRKIFKINTIFVDNLDEAFSKINLIEMVIKDNNAHIFPEEHKHEEMVSKEYIDNMVDELVRYLGTLIWEKPIDTTLNFDNNNFLSPIYEAITLIKNDVNNLLLERKKDEEKLQLANKRLELDINARERFQEERKNLEEQLHQSEKMQAIGQLAGGIAHDFNNQLAAIVGYTDLLKRNIPDQANLHKYTDSIKMVTNRAKDLTSQLLAFARKGKYHSTNVNMHDLINEVLNLSEHTMDKKIVFKQKLSATNSEVEGDPTQLQNVLLNLSINARDAMPEGGTILFETENIDSNTEWFKKRSIVLGPGDYLKLSVSDTGTGIPDGIRNHIFEPFFTTKQLGQGTGMGLAAVYGTIKNHHGAIEIDTTPGKGTTFHLILPQTENKPNEIEEINDTINQEPHSGFGDTIFLIDDEETVLETTTELLQEMGYTVFESKNPLEAIEIYKKAYDKIDVVLLDMIMPEMGGAEVYQELKKINDKVKVIITSGYSIEHEQRLINENEDVYFIQKPYDIESLNSMVNKIIHKS